MSLNNIISSQHLLINEYFLSVQGEGINTGRLALFIRFGQCNLVCSFCDSKKALKNYKSYSLADIEKILIKYRSKTKWIILTGGEPLLHDLSLLIKKVKHYKYKIAMETNGTIYQSWLNNIDWITVSPKSGSKINNKVIKKASELKFVIVKPEDIKFAEKFMPFEPSFLMPVNNDRKVVRMIIKYLETSKYKDYFRLGIQMHKSYKIK